MKLGKLKCAVIGVGYLGRFHAMKYQKLHNVDLVAVCDTNPMVCNAVAQEFGVAAYYDYRELFNKVDAVSIAATTTQHYIIAKHCLQHKIHVLIEKPITETVKQADELIALANSVQVKLQVGHLERFNAASIAVMPHLHNPTFIESKRVAQFNRRGTDVNVILDLMIHDIDMIQSIIKTPILHIDAYGSNVLTSSIDIANARLTFANKVVANVTASRVSYTTERKTHIFQLNSSIDIDYQNRRVLIFKPTANLEPEEYVFSDNDAIFEEIKAFIQCITADTTPLVTGIDGREALATATQITALIDQSQLIHQHAAV